MTSYAALAATEEQVDDKLTCPYCGSEEVAVTAEQMFMVNTSDHYCHSVKICDDGAKATCLTCRWDGRRSALVAVKEAA